MVQDSGISIFVPVLVLIVIEISQSAREFDLMSIAERQQEPFFYSVFYVLHTSSQELIEIPQLGPFNFIHGMNLAILNLGFVLIVTTSAGIVKAVTCLIIWLFWVLFPLLEVNEYVDIMDDPSVGPVSFLYHSVVTSVAAGAIFLLSETLLRWVRGGGLVGWPLAVVVGVVVLYYLDLIGFLILLQKELREAEPMSSGAAD